MTIPRTEVVCPTPHLRVILPSSMDNTMPPPFLDINLSAHLREASGDPRSDSYLAQRLSIAIQRGNAASLLETLPRGDALEDNTLDIPPPLPDFSAPPPYDVAANSKLPTYEEVQREKQMEGEGPQMGMPPPHHPTFAAFVTVENTEGANGVESLDPENSLLGTDIMFLTSFFVAFLFNWIGFLLLMCFCHTVASRYGALAGFGLSLAKWTLIVKHSTELASHENSWLWWLIMAFGVLICVRAIIQYLNIKRGWRLLSGTAQERLLFFY